MRVLVWDSDEVCQDQEKYDCIVQLRSGGEEKAVGSDIALHLEQNAVEIRANYLGLIHELGSLDVDGRALSDVFMLRTDFSYWWLTLIAEKSNSAKKNNINLVLKLMALLHFLEGKAVTKIEVVTNNRDLGESINRISPSILASGADRKNFLRVANAFQLELRRCKEIARELLKGFGWLFLFLWRSTHFRRTDREAWKSMEGGATFFSYFYHLRDPESGVFQSNYWTALPDGLRELEIQTNWIHLEITDSPLRNLSSRVDKTNEYSEHYDHERHLILTSLFKYSLLFKVFKDWFKVIRAYVTAEKIISKKLGFMAPLMRQDLVKSCFGAECLHSLLHLSLLEEAAFYLTSSNKCIYLMENQSWEHCLNYVWKRDRESGTSNPIIGFPHVATRFWDLKDFFDASLFEQNQNSIGFHIPDYLCVHGDHAKKSYLEAGYPAEKMVEVESLRFLHLLTAQKDISDGKNDRSGLVVLVLGDVLASNTAQQMAIIYEAQSRVKKQLTFIVKPHPACPIDPEQYPGFNFEINQGPISEALTLADVAICSCRSSSSVDALCSGVPVITILDSLAPNTSPLYGITDLFVYNSQQLIPVLEDLERLITADETNSNSIRNDFFYLNPDLDLWISLLSKQYIN